MIVSVEEIARAAGLTEKHVLRMIRRQRVAAPLTRRTWLGAQLRVSGDGVEFASLPETIREALVLADQPELPLPPPQWNAIIRNAA